MVQRMKTTLCALALALALLAAYVQECGWKGDPVMKQQPAGTTIVVIPLP